jgi:pSer/pThr/pTyr-binding forkhead associated (FHA) protein
VARLVVVEGKGIGTEAVLGAEACVVGRLASCGLQLDEPQSSRKHFQLEPRAGGWVVVDLGSKNGTLLNDDKVDGQAPLRDGDRLRVVDTVVAFHADPPLPTGTKLAGIELREVLGQGEQGTLYAARQGALERAVLVEVALPHVVAEPAARKRFEQRAKSAGSVEHPTLVAVLDTSEGEGRLWTVFEHAPGTALAHRFVNGPAFDRDAAVAIVRELSQALAHVHGKGLVHGLISPSVVRVDPQGHVKLGGLGEPPGARRRRHRQDAALQARYASPEEGRGEPATSASDVYSLGILAIHLLGGAPPWEGPPEDVLALHASPDPVPLPAAVDGELRELLGRMLAKSAAARPDAAAVERTLLAWTKRGGSAERPGAGEREKSGRRGPADSGRRAGGERQPERPAEPPKKKGGADSGRQRREAAQAAREAARLAALAPPDHVPLRLILLGVGYMLIALVAAVGTRIALRFV